MSSPNLGLESLEGCGKTACPYFLFRLSTADLELLKQRAAEEGLPYSSLIASILITYVSRTAPEVN